MLFNQQISRHSAALWHKPVHRRIYLGLCLLITNSCVYSLIAVIAKPSEVEMTTPRLPSRKLKGLSFSLPELNLVRCWSQAGSLRVALRLDHGSDTEEFEEVLAFHTIDSPVCRWIMWRNESAVFIQPLI